MYIRRFTEQDANEVSKLIITTFQISNSKDYPSEVIKELISRHQSDDILKKAELAHFYVAQEEEKIIGCGAISSNEQAKDESFISSIFVLPEKQGQGVGRLIIEALESDGLFLASKRIELNASITGLGFYIKLGYTFKNGITEPDKEGLYCLEKRRIIMI
ncbi:MAG: GNAT family N-acetyltransferase [Oscillospiraceae bacterium]|nr:GNAT family N-acetyltransferase [Oscillospiraceae bacterium]